MNLYEISTQYQEAFRGDENGELNMELIERMEGALEEKAVALSSYIKNLEAEKDAIATAKNNMAEREKRLSKRLTYLLDYLQTNMERTGITEITRSAYFTIKLKKNPPKVEILDEAEIPVDYIKTKVVTTSSVDKIRLLGDLKTGVEVPGAILVQNNRVEIK